MRNTGQDGQLKTNCPEIFFDILTGGCIFNLYKSIERFSSSCSVEREAIKYSKKSAKPEVDFEPNQGKIVFGTFLPKKAVLAETNYGPFLFLLRCIYGQNTSKINFLTCATDRRFRLIFMGIHS